MRAARSSGTEARQASSTVVGFIDTFLMQVRYGRPEISVYYKACPEPYGGIFGDLPASTRRGGAPSLSREAPFLLELPLYWRECRWLAMVVRVSEVFACVCQALCSGLIFVFLDDRIRIATMREINRVRADSPPSPETERHPYYS